MTTSNTTARTSAVGTATAGQGIPFTFPVSASSELLVMTRVTATGVEATLTETTDYTVTLVDSGASGGAVYLVDTLAATSECFVIRNTATTQTLDLTQGDDFNAEDIEASLDRLARLIINNSEAITRCLRAPSTDDTSTDLELDNSVDRAEQYMYFDADGDPTYVASVAPATATVTAFAETFLDDANAAAVLVTLGLTIGTNVQAYDAQLDDIATLAVTDGNFIVGDGSNWKAESGATARTSMGCPASTDTPLISTILVSMASGEILTSYRTGEIMVLTS